MKRKDKSEHWEISVGLSDEFVGHLDSPLSGESIRGPVVQVRGWVAGYKGALQLEIVAGINVVQPRTVYRRDVEEHLAQISGPDGEAFEAMCFELLLSPDEDFTISVVTELGRHTWIRARSSRVKQLSTRGSQSIALGLQNVKKGYPKVEPVAASASFDRFEDCFSNFHFFSSLRWHCELGTHYLVEGAPKYQVLQSAVVDKVNYLCIRELDTGLLYVLAQHVHHCELIHQVQTAETRVISKQHVREDMLITIEELGIIFSKASPVEISSPPAFTCGEFSPNHFFFDTLPGLYYADDILDVSVDRILIRPVNEFVNLRDLLGLHWLIEDANSNAVGQSRIEIRTGYPLGRTDPTLSRKLDNKLSYLAGKETPRFRKEARFVIWIDLSQTNRTWNQEEVLPDLLRGISASHSHVHFIFDGETAPQGNSPSVTPLPQWLQKFLEENSISFTNFQGSTSVSKLSAAFMTDFFLASFTTGSMYLSRFAGCEGIALSAPRTFRQRDAQKLFGTYGKTVIPDLCFRWFDKSSDPSWASFELVPEEFNRWATDVIFTKISSQPELANYKMQPEL